MTAGTGSAAVRWREVFTRVYGPSLALVCLGVWLHAADALLVSTMMPAIVAEIGGIRLIAWTVALYEIGSIVAGAASGLLALRLGTRRPMTAAACLFAAGCALSALAPEMWVLLAGRLLQGLGGGGLMALSFVSVGLLFPRRLVARVMGAVSTIWAVSAFLGPLIGGLFVEFATWRLGFWFFAVQAVLLALWIAARGDSGKRPAEQTAGGRFPVFRLLWLSAGVVSVAYAGIEITALRTPAFVALGVACFIVFLRLEAARGGSRLLPQRPIGLGSPLGAALTMILCFTAATIALSIYGPLIMTRLHGAPILVAGYILALEAVAWAVVAALLSGAPERRDPALIVTGITLVSLSIAGLAYSVSQGPLWLIAAFAMLQGAGFGMAWTFILRRATALAPPGEVERVAGAIPTVQRLGYALGAAFAGIVANAAGIAGENGPQPPGDTLTFAAAAIFLACLPLAALGLLAAARFVRAGTPQGQDEAKNGAGGRA
ncbi:MFS transporter [Pelagibius sp.]|uniref:MFS transporter n=1 Tax=Pelagibius sp. TaxID=1931238 RepID=UPI003B50F49A